MEEYPNIEAFYDEEPRRRTSPEADFGVWWWESEEIRWPYWRVSYIRDTGEIYAIQLLGRVKLLGTFPVDIVEPGEIYYHSLDLVLDGWAQIDRKLLRWVVERLEAHNA